MNNDFAADELLFTPNTVIVQVEGSKFDLSLIDLPGIIKSISLDKHNALIPMIENLVYYHISKKRYPEHFTQGNYSGCFQLQR